MVELLSYAQLVVDGERHALLLRPVAERRVVDVNVLGNPVMGVGRPMPAGHRYVT
jgi:hypothetical protein